MDWLAFGEKVIKLSPSSFSLVLPIDSLSYRVSVLIMWFREEQYKCVRNE